MEPLWARIAVIAVQPLSRRGMRFIAVPNRYATAITAFLCGIGTAMGAALKGRRPTHSGCPSDRTSLLQRRHVDTL